MRLFLDDEQERRLDRLWAEHRFITQWPITEHKNLPLFIGFVTQDQPKALVVYFEGLREPFRKRAEEFEKDVEAAVPKQLEALLAFAAGAYRRPLRESEKTDLTRLYSTSAQERHSARGSVPHGPDAGAGVAIVSLPSGTGAAGKGAAARSAIGNWPPD